VHSNPRPESLIVVLLGALALAACASPPVAHVGAPLAPKTSSLQRKSGNLVVYSATFASTVEQSEYPAHTDYTVATVNDTLVEHVTNRAGSFESYPAKVRLPAGAYHVRAQYDGGRFVVVPVVIKADKTTVVDLDETTPPPGTDARKQPVRLPNGAVVGWYEIGG
jgi:hypothetical protein